VVEKLVEKLVKENGVDFRGNLLRLHLVSEFLVSGKYFFI